MEKRKEKEDGTGREERKVNGCLERFRRRMFPARGRRISNFSLFLNKIYVRHCERKRVRIEKVGIQIGRRSVFH